MWSNPQRDGRPAEHRWRPLLNAAVWLTPTTWLPCSNAAKTRKPLKLARVPQTGKWSQPLLGRSSPYCGGHLEDILLLDKFFPIVDTCLSCEDIARQSCAMVPIRQFLATFWVLHFQLAVSSTFQTCILNSHEGHTMCGSRPMAEIQSATAKIRRGKKKRKNKEETTGGNIMVCPIP